MKLSQKRAISYSIYRKQKHNQYCFLLWKNLLSEFKESKYRTMTWFIKSKGLEKEYNEALFYYGHNLENLPIKY